MKYILVDSNEALKKEAKHWVDEIGVDIECENNQYYFGEYISIIQISTKEKDWIVDILNIDDYEPLRSVFEDENVLKIFHGCEFDMWMLKSDTEINPKNIYDTQMSLLLTGRTKIGLSDALEEFFKLKKEKKFQKANWTKRPLNKEMVEYAVNDSKYLIELKNKLEIELDKMGRKSWAKEEFKYIETRDKDHHKQTIEDLKGFNDLNPNQRSVLKTIFRLRLKYAEKVNRPEHYIINAKKMIELSTNLPKSVKEWSYLKGVHRIVKQKAEIFFKDTQKAKEKKLIIPKKNAKKFTVKQKQIITKISEKRDEAATKANLPKHMIMNKEQLKDIAINERYKSLRNWQKELLNLELD